MNLPSLKHLKSLKMAGGSLDVNIVDKEPMFYQHVTDEVFEKLIQQSVSRESTDIEQCEEHDILLSYGEGDLCCRVCHSFATAAKI